MKHLFRLVAALLLVPPATLQAAPNTNIILIMADDFGYECVTANGGQSCQTPPLDWLAANGVRFEQCHAQPLCTPTREYHVSFIASWPAVLQQGRVSRDLISSTDFQPTICTAAGIPVPANVDGVRADPESR